MGDMKEIHDAALAYYRNLTEDQRLDVYRFFRAMDKDGDGAITIQEFEQIIAIKEFEQIFVRSRNRIDRLFQDVDKNGDGKLEFEESVTLFYCIVNKRFNIACKGSRCNVSFLKGLYFTCVDCFDHNQTTTFDLCTSCYGNRNYVHHHSKFLDNYALLRTKAACNNKSGSTNQPSTPKYQDSRSGSQTAPSTPKYQDSRSGSQTAIGVLKAVNTGVHAVSTGVHAVNTGVDLVNNGIDIGNTVANIASFASLCSIM